jgi:hypothetical protein
MRDEAKVGAHVATEISRIGSTTYLGEGTALLFRRDQKTRTNRPIN